MNEKPIAAIHGLRGVAALAVVLGHCAQLAQPPGAAVSPLLMPLRYASSMAVPTFIILSGFLLALPVARHGSLRGGAWGFMARRALRILPAYYLALAALILVAVAVTHTVAAADISLRNRDMIGPLLLLHDVVGTPHAYDPPLWSLAVEWHCYLAFPVVVAAWGRWGLARTAVVGATLAMALVLPLRSAGYGWVQPQFYALFILGACAAYASTLPRVRAYRGWGGVAAVAATAYLALLLPAGWDGYGADPARYEVLIGVVLAPALLWMAGGGCRALASWPAMRLGDCSYSLYLLHYPIAEAVAMHVPQGDPLQRFAAIAALVLPLSLAAAWGLYRVAERPVMRTATRPALAN